MDKYDVAAALDAGMALSGPKMTTDGGEYAVVPEGATLHSLEILRDMPRRARGVVMLLEQESFVAFVKREKTHAALLFADVGPIAQGREPSMVAVLNAGDVDKPGWRDYRAEYPCFYNPDFKDWMELHLLALQDKGVDPTHFAEFVEDHIHTIAEPNGAELVEIGRNFQAKSDATFTKVESATGGTRELHYAEKVEAGSAGPKGTIKFPERITLVLPIFQSGHQTDPQKNTAAVVKLVGAVRFRLGNGKATIIIKFDRPQVVVEDAFRAMVDQVARETSLQALFGKPGKPIEPPKVGDDE